ncbi:MAG: DUF4339 domain-containing protein [Alphaproteobacteria bacterium]|nr:DUF4339 domain-containing protein [Alphaproteobacteria bacterium]
MSEKTSELVWYIARDGQQHGPLSDAEMQLFVESGHLKPTDLVWNQEMPEWKAAPSVFPPKPAAPPPPPPPPAVPQPPRNAAPAAPASPASTTPKESEPATKSKLQPTLSSAHSVGDKTARNDAAPSGANQAGSLPSPEEVLPSFRTQRATPEPEPVAKKREPSPIEDYEDEDYDDEGSTSRVGRIGMIVGTAAVVTALVAGGYMAFLNQDAIVTYMNEQTGTSATANNAPPVVKAESGTKTASLENPSAAPAPPAAAAPPPAPAIEGPRIEGITVTIPPSAPAAAPPASADTSDRVPLVTIDSNLQKSQLWQVIKAEFPGWYQERVNEISRLSNSASETDLSKHLIGKLVALRRENATQALASSTGSLQSVASAFLTNLKSLAGHSTEACYTFISKGETSPAVIALFPKPGYGDAIEGQIAAVFRAVADGRKTPIQRPKATKPDYDVLAGELTKIGWSKADLGLFSNPQALAKAPPEQVCKMVQDWFTAHIAIEDKAVQERLLVETLRPVIAG